MTASCTWQVICVICFFILSTSVHGLLEGKLAVWHRQGNNIVLHDGFSFDNSTDQVLLQHIQPRTTNDRNNKFQYQIRGDWIWFFLEYPLTLNRVSTRSNETVIHVGNSYSEIYILDWCLVEEHSMAYIVLEDWWGIVSYNKIQIWDTDSGTLLNSDEYSNGDYKFIAYDKMADAVIYNLGTALHMIDPVSRATMGSYNFNLNACTIVGELFAFNYTVWTGVHCTSSYYDYSLVRVDWSNPDDIVLSWLTNLPVSPYEIAKVIAVSWEYKFAVWSTNDYEHAKSFITSWQADPVHPNKVIEKATGVVNTTSEFYAIYVFPAAIEHEETLTELAACSLAGRFIDNQCHCDENHYTSTCGGMCYANQCINGYCGPDGECVCYPGYQVVNSTYCINTYPSFPCTFSTVFTQSNISNPVSPITYAWNYSLPLLAERYNQVANPNIFLIIDGGGGVETQSIDGANCSAISISSINPIIPLNSYLAEDNYNGNPDQQLWRSFNGMVEAVLIYVSIGLDTFQFPSVITDHYLGIQRTFDEPSFLPLASSDSSWLSVPSFCNGCLNNPNQCVSSTPSISILPSSSSTASRYALPSSSPSASGLSPHSFSATPSETKHSTSNTPSLSHSNSRSPSHFSSLTSTPSVSSSAASSSVSSASPVPFSSPSPSLSLFASGSSSPSVSNTAAWQDGEQSESENTGIYFSLFVAESVIILCMCCCCFGGVIVAVLGFRRWKKNKTNESVAELLSSEMDEFTPSV